MSKSEFTKLFDEITIKFIKEYFYSLINYLHSCLHFIVKCAVKLIPRSKINDFKGKLRIKLYKEITRGDLFNFRSTNDMKLLHDEIDKYLKNVFGE